MEYHARNYARNTNPENKDIDEWWSDNPFVVQAFVAGARKMVEELRALGTPGIDAGDDLLEDRLENHDIHFIATPHEPDEPFASDLNVRIGFGAEEVLAPAPFPIRHQHMMTNYAHGSKHPAIYTLACRMIQEVHGGSPSLVRQLTPRLARYILNNFDVTEGFEISVEEVIEFCDRMISDGQVRLDSVQFPFNMYDPEERNLEAWEKLRPDHEKEDKDDDDEDPLPPLPPVDGAPL
jgi:hypothetical protein